MNQRQNKSVNFLIIVSILFVYIGAQQVEQNLMSLISAPQLIQAQFIKTIHPVPQPRLRTMVLMNVCQSNQVENFQNICLKPQYIEGCQIYETSTTCYTCSKGYKLSKVKKCDYQSLNAGLNHIVGCLKQASAVICETCAAGFYFRQNKCHIGVKNCVQYDKQGSCSECQHEYSLILSSCRRNNILGCKIQTDTHACTQCYAPFALNGQHCDIQECRILNDYGCVACECGYYINAERTCQPIAPGCLRYEKGICKDCLPHYKLKGGVCEIEGCLQYTGNYCKRCSQKYLLLQGECHFVNCYDWLHDQCIACKQGFGLNNGLCVSATHLTCA